MVNPILLAAPTGHMPAQEVSGRCDLSMNPLLRTLDVCHLHPGAASRKKGRFNSMKRGRPGSREAAQDERRGGGNNLRIRYQYEQDEKKLVEQDPKAVAVLTGLKKNACSRCLHSSKERNK
ncbi:hypothetical protein TNIN_500611 [Trichonephila inaurata madagascariensis]|uniref:Uncharacterized protein n=1 Tax=Trichonephila inaurata madagascariensis TaxID=2747483 RepID=A0A8X6MIP8_9ARAC|nr:hypothetical protein TNIN_500611 [Trichonephila inaurata madagascariensis]